MKSTHSEDLEYLRNLRGCFGSRRMWAVEYEFTGSEIIKRRGGRIKDQISISDIIEIDVPLMKKLMILKTNRTTLEIHIIPSLGEAMQKESAKCLAAQSEGDRQRFEEVRKKIITRHKWAVIIGVIVSALVVIVGRILIGWFEQKH